MNLIVIGASGFIGERVYQYAQKSGINVFGTSLRESEGLYKYDLRNDNIADVMLKMSFNAGKKYAVIASFFGGHERIFNNLDEANFINVEKTKELLNYFHKNDIKTLYISTEQVFDGLKEEPYNEEDEVCPILTYGRQKVEVEKYIFDNMPDFLIYRLSQVIGDSPAGKKGNHIWHDVYDSHLKKENVKCIKNQIFCPTYVNDIAKYIIGGLQKNLKGVYHVSNPEAMSRAELSQKLLNALNSQSVIEEVDVSYFNFSEPRVLKTAFNTDKFRSQFDDKFVSMDDLAKIFVKNI